MRMKHHFSLTFRVSGRQGVNVDQVASQMIGSDFLVESESLNGTEFSVHFEREGGHSTDLLTYAREQVLKVVPQAELVSMDMSQKPTKMSMVDDITKLVIRAVQLFGDAELAHTWLSQPQDEVDGSVPKVLMIDPEGRTQVGRALTKLESETQAKANGH